MNLKEFGIEKDKNDILKSFKSRFVNNPNEIYLDGNSLGKLPKTSYSEISELPFFDGIKEFKFITPTLIKDVLKLFPVFFVFKIRNTHFLRCSRTLAKCISP